MSDAPSTPSRRSGRFGFAAVPRKVVWIILANALGGVGFGYLIVFITAYLLELGVEGGAIGLILGAEGASMVLTAVPLGLYSDRHGRRGLLVFGSAVIPPAVLIFAFTTDILWLTLASVIVGVGEGAFLSAWNAIIADQTATDQRNAAFSLSFVLGNIAFGIGLVLPFAFPWIEAWTGMDSHAVHVWTLILTDALAFLQPFVFVVLLRGVEETVRPPEARPRTMEWRRFLTFSGLNGLIGLGAGFFIPLVATWMLLKFDVMDNWSGPVLAVANVTIGAAGIVSPPLAKRFGPIRAMVLVQALSTVFMVSLAFLTNVVAAAAFYVVRAALMNMSGPIGDAFLMGIIAPEQRGVASAVNSIIWRIPNSVTTIIGGYLMQAGYLDLPIFLAAAFYLVAITGIYAVFRNVQPTT